MRDTVSTEPAELAAPFTLHLGDCIEVMRTLPECCVDSIVTDPPYELGFMGKSWDASGIANNVDMWREALRVLKPGGHLLAFSGSRTYHRMTCAIEDAGFEIRDQIMWVYGSGFPKSRNLDGEWEGWGTALKPAHEPICFARKPLAGTVAANVMQYGPGALNIDGCRIHSADAQGGAYTVKRLKSGATLNATGGNWRPEEAEAAVFHGEMKPGRWPANLIHDGSTEVVALFPAEAGQAAALKTRNSDKTRNTFGDFAGTKDANFAPHDARGSAARFFYCAKSSRADRNEGLASFEAPAVAKNATMRDCETADWSHRNGNHHPTVKPTDLMAYLARLVTPPGGVVLDPFMGSGSTGKACMREGFRFLGIDMTPEYMAIAQARIEYELARVTATAEAAAVPAPQRDLFEDAA
ncbi:site-specific DNA-methyltransferase [Massilia sp.]|uniref:DNA-methyltransferase n=1 Tax=Massilia sp. TaxID=1882437 RepID=UPI0028971C52|nr:site-specific DNA-methyltransferase [Massilia sp.]